MRIYRVPLQKLTEKVQSVAYIEYKGSQFYCNTTCVNEKLGLKPCVLINERRTKKEQNSF